MTLRRLAMYAALLGAVTTAIPAWAQTVAPGTQATFYEVTENMRLTASRKPHRLATSALAGAAQVGTPFCQTALVRAVSDTAPSCLLTALGEDDVSLVTGLGTFDAKIAVVVQGDNPVDPPEFVIAKLRVSGNMNFTPAILNGLPYGTVTGRSFVAGADDAGSRFIGVFRLPFLASPEIRGALCPNTPKPNRHLPQDLAYIDTTQTGQLTGSCIDVRPEELSLGFPAVRFDIWFQ
jgi:hypothetical protein